VINKIDGPALRKPQSQRLLCQLSRIENLHIIASIDHLMEKTLWDPQLEARFRWRRVHVRTDEHYDMETHCDMASFLQPTTNQRAKGIVHVLKSLTVNHRELLETLAETILDDSPNGLSFQSFYDECYDSMLVSNDSQFRELLGELIDHNLVKIKKDSAEDLYTIPYPPEVIRKHILTEE